MLKVHQPAEMLSVELQFRIGNGPACREDGKQTPLFQTGGNKPILELVKSIVIPAVHAGDDIELYIRFCGKNPYGLFRMAETAGNSAHPFMVITETVQTDCCGMHAGSQQGFYAARRHQQAVGHQSPRKFHVIYGTPALFQVLAHKGFPACYDNHDTVRVPDFPHPPQHLAEIFERHVRN